MAGLWLKLSSPWFICGHFALFSQPLWHQVKLCASYICKVGLVRGVSEGDFLGGSLITAKDLLLNNTTVCQFLGSGRPTRGPLPQAVRGVRRKSVGGVLIVVDTKAGLNGASQLASTCVGKLMRHKRSIAGICLNDVQVRKYEKYKIYRHLTRRYTIHSNVRSVCPLFTRYSAMMVTSPLCF